MYQFNYIDPRYTHFVTYKKRFEAVNGRGSRKKHWYGEVAEDQAAIRRELRGLVVKDNQVVVRGLHKFFNLGQHEAVNLKHIKHISIRQVTEKLDGQMICGVVVGERVQFWSRKGNTVVGKSAARVATSASGDYDGLIKEAHTSGCTATFEFVGRQSKICADEGTKARLVLLAVRTHKAGDYWSHDRISDLGTKYGVEVVRRFTDLEHLPLQVVRDKVQQWRNREGVIVQLTNGLWIKIKSHWWRQNQWSNHKQASAKEQEAKEQSRLQVLRSRSKLLEQRLAAVAWPKGTNTKTVKRAFPEAVRAEMVYDDRGKLKVVMVSFKEASQCEAALRKEAVVGKRTLVTSRAYSRRARSNGKNRVMVHTWLGHGRSLLRRRDTKWGREEEQKRKQEEQDILMWEQQLEQERAKREQERRDILRYTGTDEWKLRKQQREWDKAFPDIINN